MSLDTIINRQLHKWESQQKAIREDAHKIIIPVPIITVSRQTGSRGSYLARRLSEELDYQLLHRDIINQICATSGYEKRIIESIDEKYRSDLDLLVETLLTGKTIDHYIYLRSLYKVVLSMSKLGGVILMGRGGNFILGPKRGFHIRVVAPFEKRVENLKTYLMVGQTEAVEKIEQSDMERKQFIKKLFNADIDDAENYDMLINTELIDIEDMVGIIKKAVEAKREKLTHNE